MNTSIWSIRSLEPTNLASLLAGIEEIRAILCQQTSASIPIAPAADRLEHVKQQVRVIASLSIEKLKSLCELLHCSIDRKDWLTYGMGGRSLIEHAASLRYYLREKVVPLIPEDPRSVTPEAIAQIQLAFFQLIRGGRFDWSNLLEEWLKGVALPETPSPQQPSQVNILTCIQKWAKDEPRVEQLYAMFCDLVHPNLGSNLLVLGITPEKLTFGPACEHSLGESIACGTGLALLSIARSYLQAIERMQATADGKLDRNEW
jgi:hypothetical protein